jgi:hypothetical protein
VAALLFGLYGQRTLSLHRARADVSRMQRLQGVVAGNGTGLERYATEDADLVKRTREVQSALADDVDAAGLMDEITAALPPDVWLLSISLAMPNGKTPGSAVFSFGGVDRTSAAHWLEAGRSMTGLLGGVWVSSISDQGTAHGGVQFTSTATILPTAGHSRAASFTVPR